MTVGVLAEKLALTPVAVCEPAREIDGVYIGDLLSWVMGRAQSGNVWITIMSNINIVAVASLADTSCIILAEDVDVRGADDDVHALQGQLLQAGSPVQHVVLDGGDVLVQTNGLDLLQPVFPGEPGKPHLP